MRRHVTRARRRPLHLLLLGVLGAVGAAHAQRAQQRIAQRRHTRRWAAALAGHLLAGLLRGWALGGRSQVRHQHSQQLRRSLPGSSIHVAQQVQQQLLARGIGGKGSRKGALLRRCHRQHGAQRCGVQLAGGCRQQSILQQQQVAGCRIGSHAAAAASGGGACRLAPAGF